MKSAEFTEAVKARNEKAFAQVPDARARQMINAVLREIGAQLDQATEGKVTVPGLGVFVVRQPAGEAGASAVKRVAFRRTHAKIKG